MSKINTYIDQYRIVASKGKGGYGQVYEVKDDTLDKTYALKLLNDTYDEESIKRFEREIKIHKSLEHENIMSILDFKLDKKNNNYYLMNLADKSLAEIISEYREDNLGKYMDDETVYYYFSQILQGIEFAHKEGVIHRDLKPMNILSINDTLKISDFGLGKFINLDITQLTQTRIGIGTEVYAAPEQYQGRNAKCADERSDIYSLGKILYEMITYDLPFIIDDNKLDKTKFRYIIKKATKYNPEDRFKSIEEMRNKLEVLFLGNIRKGDVFENFSKKYTMWENTENTNYLLDILNLMQENSDNYTLYVDYFMKLSYYDMQVMYKNFLDEYINVLEIYVKHINCQHPFSFIDKITNFLMEVLKIVDNIDLFKNIIIVMLNLGFNHNRFYLAERLSNYISSIQRDIEKMMIVTECFEENRYQANWLKNYLDKNSIDMIETLVS